MAADLLASGSHCQKRMSPSISPEQFAEETRQILDNFLRRHLADIRPDVIHTGFSNQSSGSAASDGVGSEMFGLPLVALRKRKISPWHHMRSAPTSTAVEFNENEQAETHHPLSLTIGEEPAEADGSRPVSSSLSSQNSKDADEALQNRGFDAEPSSSSTDKDGRQHLRLKKSAFKRAKERLRRSFMRTTPVRNSTKKKRVDSLSRNSSSPMNGRHVVKLPNPAFQRSTSVGVSKQSTTKGEQPPRRRRLLERLRSLGRSTKQELPVPVERGTSEQTRKKQRPRDFPKTFRELSDSLTALRDRIGASPRRRRKEFSDHAGNNLREDYLETSQMSINVQRPSTSSASNDNSNIGSQPLTPSTVFATLSLSAHVSQASSHKSQYSSDSDVYAQIATRLAQLGDEYVYGAIEAARLQQEEGAGCAVNRDSDQLTELERDVLSWVQSTSGQQVDRPEGLDELTQASTSNEFGMAIDRAVRRRAGAPATQLALVFHFTSAAIRAVGATSMAARRLGDYCVSYVGNKFADWLIDQGGWMSVVEDASTSCSEID